MKKINNFFRQMMNNSFVKFNLNVGKTFGIIGLGLLVTPIYLHMTLLALGAIFYNIAIPVVFYGVIFSGLTNY